MTPDRVAGHVYTCGVFDMFHLGHLRLLQNARAAGDGLIVGLVVDEAVADHKGEERPFQRYEERRAFIDALGIADEVVRQASFDPAPVLRDLGDRVEAFALGADQHHIVMDYVEEAGIPVIHLPRTDGVSTTDLIRRIREAGGCL